MPIANILRRRALMGLMGLACAAATAQGQPAVPAFILATDTEEKSYYGLWLRRVYGEALQRLGYRLEVLQAPPNRASVLSEQGLIDGEMVRAPVYATAHQELMMVDMVLIISVFGIYAQSAMPGLNSLDELLKAGGAVGYRRGVLTCENALKPLIPAERLREVVSADQALSMLARGNVRFICEIDSSVANAVTMTGARETPAAQRLFSLGEPRQLYPFVHRRHAALAPKLAATLRRMKTEGLMERYRVEVLRELVGEEVRR